MNLVASGDFPGGLRVVSLQWIFRELFIVIQLPGGGWAVTPQVGELKC